MDFVNDLISALFIDVTSICNNIDRLIDFLAFNTLLSFVICVNVLLRNGKCSSVRNYTNFYLCFAWDAVDSSRVQIQFTFTT